MRFAAGHIEPLVIDRPDAIAGMYLLSPFVWRANDRWRMLLRVVPHCDDPVKKIARIHYGESSDGLRFRLEGDAAIAPGPDADDKEAAKIRRRGPKAIAATSITRAGTKRPSAGSSCWRTDPIRVRLPSAALSYRGARNG